MSKSIFVGHSGHGPIASPDNAMCTTFTDAELAAMRLEEFQRNQVEASTRRKRVPMPGYVLTTLAAAVKQHGKPLEGKFYEAVISAVTNVGRELSAVEIEHVLNYA